MSSTLVWPVISRPNWYRVSSSRSEYHPGYREPTKVSVPAAFITSRAELKAEPKSWSSPTPATTVIDWTFSAKKRSEEHTSELQSRENLVCRLLLEKKKSR